MSGTRVFRLLLAVIIAFPVLRAVPAYSWHGSGNVTALAIDPQRPTTLYAGTSDRGVFKTTDGGASWGATGLTNVEVWALAIDPVTPTTLYAVSGWQYYFGASYQKLYKSTDGGANWDLIIVNLASASFHSLVIDPQTPTTLYGLGDGVFKSTDGGASWSATGLTGVGPGWGLELAFRVSSLVIHPQTPTTLYAGTSVITVFDENGFPLYYTSGDVFKSTDGGATWGAVGLASEALQVSVSDLAIDPLTPTTLYAGTNSGPDAAYGCGVFESTDGGASWSATSLTDCVSQLAIDPPTPTTLYAVSSIAGVFKTTDGGATWSPVNAGLTDVLQAFGFSLYPLSFYLRDLAVDPQNLNIVYLATIAGVFKSTDGAGYWSPTGLFQHSPLTALSLNPTSVVTGSTATGTVTLASAAPVGGVAVTLSSSNPAVATVPASVTVPAGATSATFTVSTSGCGSVEIFAALDDATRSARLNVVPPVNLSSLILNPTSVSAGSESTGTVTLSGQAPPGGIVVRLSSPYAEVATVPASVTIAAGTISANFTVTTSAVLPFGLSSVSAAILASYCGVSLYQYLQVTLPAAASLSTVSLDPTSVTGGTTSTGMVTLNAAAPSGGAVVALSSSNTAVASVPASVTVAAGSMRQLFTVSTSAVAASTSVTISGTYGGVTRSAELAVTTATTTLVSLNLNSASMTAGSASTGTVTLSAAAPAGGVAVTLSSSNIAVAMVPASVVVPAGATSANFTVSTAYCASGPITVSGTYGGVTRSAELTVILPVADRITIQLADYFANKRELRVAAKSTSRGVRLWVYVASTGELIGELANLGDGKYSGQFMWSVNPQNITVRSSLCGLATSVVRSK